MTKEEEKIEIKEAIIDDDVAKVRKPCLQNPSHPFLIIFVIESNILFIMKILHFPHP
jgi:hypothetical protein